MRARPMVGAPAGRARTRFTLYRPGGHVDTATQAWLKSQLGTATDFTDLEGRYGRLGSARAVALEVLNERLADLRAQAASINVSGVVSVSIAENIKAYERQIASLTAGDSPAPDEPSAGEGDDGSSYGLIYFHGMSRR